MERKGKVGAQGIARGLTHRVQTLPSVTPSLTPDRPPILPSAPNQNRHATQASIYQEGRTLLATFNSRFSGNQRLARSERGARDTYERETRRKALRSLSYSFDRRTQEKKRLFCNAG